MLLSKFRIIFDSHDPTLTLPARNMVDKFEKYDVVLCIKLAKHAKILDLCIKS